MIIGGDRAAVIENIRAAAESGDFYKKVELNDPVLSKAEEAEITDGFLSSRNGMPYRFKSFLARRIADTAMKVVNKNTEVIGAEKVEGFKGKGAVITSNHFSPFENTVIRKLVKEYAGGRLDIVSQSENFKMQGIIGFLMNYADTVPLSGDHRYMQKGFIDVLGSMLKKGDKILIYPEQEMWFNYRKPRPGKRGAYYYAAKLAAPVISCFVEIKDLESLDTEDFYNVKYILHILGVLYPDEKKSVRENSIEMCERDNELKKEAYERIYGKKLDYGFEKSDIAGLVRYPLKAAVKNEQ